VCSHMCRQTSDMPSMRSNGVLETRENKASITNLDSRQNTDTNTERRN